MVTWGHVTNQKQNTSSSAWPMATKLGRVVTYDERNSLIISDDTLIKWWGDVTNWKFNIYSSVRLMITKHGRLVTYGKRNHPVCKVFFCGRVIVLCLRENARIIFGYWLHKNCANFSWVGENFFVFRLSTFAVSLSKFLFSVVKKVANIPLFLVFQITLHRL